MRARLNRIRLRDLALFVVVAGAVAVTAVCGAQEAGLDGERAEATAGPISLSLRATQQICETKAAWEYWLSDSYEDQDGNLGPVHSISS